MKGKRGPRPEAQPKRAAKRKATAKARGKLHKTTHPKGSRKKRVSRPKMLRQAAFLAALARTGRIGKAAAAVPMDRGMHYWWLREDPAYPALFQETMERAADAWEDEAARRAIEGTVKPVFWRGYRCGGIREYSDGLLQFLLRGARPDKYRERATTEHVTPVGRPIQTEMTIRLVRPGDPELVDNSPAGT